MPELANFPMISQRDGDPNQNYDCVPASLAACLEWLTGKNFSAGEVKDAVYGKPYIGGTAAIEYVAYCAFHGVKLAAINGDGVQLVTALHMAIESQHPAIITEPSSLAGWTHVCAAYRADPGSVTVMDPWLDAPVTKSDDYWAGRLEFHQIWTLEKLEENVSIDINTPGIGDHFTQSDANHWQSKATGKTIQYAMLNSYKSEGNRGLCGWDVLGAPMSNEIALPAPYAPGSVKQYYRNGVRAWDAKTGSVTPLALYDGGPGEDPMIATLNQQIQQLQAQQPTVDHSAADKLDKIKVIVNS